VAHGGAKTGNVAPVKSTGRTSCGCELVRSLKRKKKRGGKRSSSIKRAVGALKRKKGQLESGMALLKQKMGVWEEERADA